MMKINKITRNGCKNEKKRSNTNRTLASSALYSFVGIQVLAEPLS